MKKYYIKIGTLTNLRYNSKIRYIGDGDRLYYIINIIITSFVVTVKCRFNLARTISFSFSRLRTISIDLLSLQ